MRYGKTALTPHPPQAVPLPPLGKANTPEVLRVLGLRLLTVCFIISEVCPNKSLPQWGKVADVQTEL